MKLVQAARSVAIILLILILVHSVQAATNRTGTGEGDIVALTAADSSTDPGLTVNGTLLAADFSASPTSGYVPATITFTDMSTGSPISWIWDFGDGGRSTGQNPTHLYEKAGSFTVIMTAWNAQNSVSQVSKTNYINILNGAIKEADTSIAGLTITNCGGPQTISVDVSILTSVLSSDNSVLEIHPPAGSGFKNITFKGNFQLNNNLITGNPDSVHLESEDIAPSLGFSGDIGTNASFYYALDLPLYPCNAKLSTEIMEGISPHYNTKFQQIASANDVFPVGTAYTATITKTNFPSGTPAKIYMSVNSGWRPSLYGDYIFIWRIADDETYGQFLPTHYLYSDPVTNLDYYEADSPLGLSTIGISATTGNNNPFQIVIIVITNIINQQYLTQSGTRSGPEMTTLVEPDSSNPTGTHGLPAMEEVPIVQVTPPVLTQPAINTFIGMIGWLLSIIQKEPVILVGIMGVIGVVTYFGWWKERL
ncbi:MAG: PKD domain-containing protein [Methanoregula sp.]|nr:PKD domain-containing protein [Methanoregula sp.]